MGGCASHELKDGTTCSCKACQGGFIMRKGQCVKCTLELVADSMAAGACQSVSVQGQQCLCASCAPGFKNANQMRSWSGGSVRTGVPNVGSTLHCLKSCPGPFQYLADPFSTT